MLNKEGSGVRSLVHESSTCHLLSVCSYKWDNEKWVCDDDKMR